MLEGCCDFEIVRVVSWKRVFRLMRMTLDNLLLLYLITFHRFLQTSTGTPVDSEMLTNQQLLIHDDLNTLKPALHLRPFFELIMNNMWPVWCFGELIFFS